MSPKAPSPFSWAPAPAAGLPPRAIAAAQSQPYPVCAHSPCALHHTVPKINYGHYAAFTRESLSSGL